MAKFDRSLLPEAPNLDLEKRLWQAGLRSVAGLDEAGRGALAGPVVAAAVVFSQNSEETARLEGIQDSKLLSAGQRRSWADEIENSVQDFGTGIATAGEIDDIGILPATRLAMSRAIGALACQPEHLLIDHILLPDLPIPQTALTKGDARSRSIAAAAVLAKVARDTLMCDLDETYPGYDFGRHKGYGTQAHRQRIQNQGPSPAHRYSFAPLREQTDL